MVPLSSGTPCYTSMSLQKPRTDKTNTGSKESKKVACSVGCNLQPHYWMPLNPTNWTFNFFHLYTYFIYCTFDYTVSSPRDQFGTSLNFQLTEVGNTNMSLLLVCIPRYCIITYFLIFHSLSRITSFTCNN